MMLLKSITVRNNYSTGPKTTLTVRVIPASTTYGMDFSAVTTTLMTNDISGINTEIKVSGQKLETVTNFKYLGSLTTNEGSKPKILPSIALTTAALTRLKPVWNDRSISFNSKIGLCAPLSHPSSCTLVDHGPSQQSSKEEYKPWKRGSAQHNTHLIQRPCYQRESPLPGSSRQSDHTKTS